MAFFIILLSVFLIYAEDGLEIPAYTDTTAIIRHFAFTLEYSENYEQAKWVAYVLTRGNAAGNNVRSNNFRKDPAVKTGSATLADYKGSGYDRGHLAPAADFKWSGQAIVDICLHRTRKKVVFGGVFGKYARIGRGNKKPPKVPEFA